MGARKARRCLVTVAVAAVALSAAATAPAADHGAGARFHVVTNLHTSLASDPTCFGLAVTAAGGVSGTHIGNGDWVSGECLDSFSRPGIILVHGHGVITAADGDQLFVDYDVTTPVPDATGAIHASGTYTIVGGTGRFAGSTGSGTTVADGNVFAFTATDTLDGTIHLGH